MAAPVPMVPMVPMVPSLAKGSLSSNPFVGGNPYEPSPTPAVSASVIGSIPF